MRDYPSIIVFVISVLGIIAASVSLHFLTSTHECDIYDVDKCIAYVNCCYCSDLSECFDSQQTPSCRCELPTPSIIIAIFSLVVSIGLFIWTSMIIMFDNPCNSDNVDNIFNIYIGFILFVLSYIKYKNHLIYRPYIPHSD